MYPTFFIVALALVISLLAKPVEASARADSSPVFTEVALRGGGARLLAALGFEGPIERSRLLLELARRLHRADTPDERALLRLLERYGTVKHADAGESLPLPLTERLWTTVILRRSVPPDRLALSILRDRRAALMYTGLLAMTDSTLRYLTGRQELVGRLTRDHAAVFSAFGRSVVVGEDGRVVTPGPSGLVPQWERIVGARVDAPDAFIAGLIQRDEGRLAYLYDTLAHLDAPHLGYVLTRGSGVPEPDVLQRLYGAIAAFEPNWDIRESPFSRLPFDPATLLRDLAVTPAGMLAGPSSAALWTGVFSSETGRVSGPGAPSGNGLIDAASLIATICVTDRTIRRERLAAFLFAQRIGWPEDAPHDDLVRVLRGYSRYPALLLTMERMGARDLETQLWGIKAADAIASLEPAARTVAIAQVQGALAILDRLTFTRALTSQAAQGLARDLLTGAARPGRPGREIARWLEGRLLPAIPSPIGSKEQREPESPLEARLLGALAGETGALEVDEADRLITWEEFAYRVDLGLSDHERLVAAWRRSPEESLDRALQLWPGGGAQGAARPAREPEALLADILTALAYAPHAVDAAGPLPITEIARRHDFGARSGPRPKRMDPAWGVPREVPGAGAAWHVEGALLGLDLPLGRFWLRRIGTDLPLRPVLNENQREAFVWTVAMTNPRDLTGPARDEIVAAISRGRARVRDSSERAFEDVARDAGLSEWRRRLLQWSLAHDRPAIVDFFSLGELLWLGQPALEPDALAAWGIAQPALEGCFCLRLSRVGAWEEFSGRPETGQLAVAVPDVKLRIAELLVELRLPAVLARGVLQAAMQEYLDAVQPGHPDDWMSLVRAAKLANRERMEDYVSSLTVEGPLIATDVPAATR